MKMFKAMFLLVLSALCGAAPCGEEGHAGGHEKMALTLRGKLLPRAAGAQEGVVASFIVMERTRDAPDETMQIELFAKGEIAAELKALAAGKGGKRKLYVTGVVTDKGLEVTEFSSGKKKKDKNKQNEMATPAPKGAPPPRPEPAIEF